MGSPGASTRSGARRTAPRRPRRRWPPPRGPRQRPGGTKCWRPVAFSSSQALTDIGAQFPSALPADANVEPTLPTRGGWIVPVQVGSDNTMFTIDAKTHLVTSVLTSSGAIRVGGDVQTLSSVPALPQPEPRC